jgi:hypothetical protein
MLGLHLTAWGGFFPSNVESLMWRISGLIIAGSGFITGIVLLIRAKYYLFPSLPFRYIVSDIALTSALVIYAAARIFLVAEAFISVRNLPIEAYELPRWTVWTQFIPHI